MHDLEYIALNLFLRCLRSDYIDYRKGRKREKETEKGDEILQV